MMAVAASLKEEEKGVYHFQLAAAINVSSPYDGLGWYERFGYGHFGI